MANSVFDRLIETMPLFEDLVAGIGDDAIQHRLPVPSNTIWDQLWCVVGGRESYAKAISSGEWAGFTCSLTADDRGSKTKIGGGLKTSRLLVEEAGRKSPGSPFVLDCLLHDTQHQGQLIRYVYGLGLEFPESWRARWGV